MSKNYIKYYVIDSVLINLHHTITIKNTNLGDESFQGSKLVPDEKMAGMHAL